MSTPASPSQKPLPSLEKFLGFLSNIKEQEVANYAARVFDKLLDGMCDFETMGDLRSYAGKNGVKNAGQDDTAWLLRGNYTIPNLGPVHEVFMEQINLLAQKSFADHGIKAVVATAGNYDHSPTVVLEIELAEHQRQHLKSFLEGRKLQEALPASSQPTRPRPSL